MSEDWRLYMKDNSMTITTGALEGTSDTEVEVLDVDAEALREVMLERGRFKFHAGIKQAEEDDGGRRIISGFANTRNLDRVNEVVDPNAFRGTLKQWMKNPVILADHWPSVQNVIGRGVEAKIDDKGFFLKAEIAKGTQLADDTWTLIQQKMLRAFSIGYRILKDEFVDAADAGKDFAGKVRKILKLELYEVSVVAIPANRESLFSVSKGMLYGTDLMAPVDESEILRADLDQKPDDVYHQTLTELRSINQEMEEGLVLNELRTLKEKIKR
jgi:HK97 family phage prohead protease